MLTVLSYHSRWQNIVKCKREPLIIPLCRLAVLQHTCAELFFQSVTHLRAIWIHAVRYLHIQMMYFAAPWKSPVPEKISLLLANTHFISLRHALYLTAEFIHFLLVPLPHVLAETPSPAVPGETTLCYYIWNSNVAAVSLGNSVASKGFNRDLHLARAML